MTDLHRLWRVILCLLLVAAWVGVAGAEEEQSVSPGAAVQMPEAGHLPEFLTEARAGGELFGGREGYVHPFFSLTEYYTDNLFNRPQAEEEEFITVFSPGVWAAFPAMSRQPLQVTTLNSAPGGLEVTRFPVEALHRYQAYGLYRADITRHRDFSDEDSTYQRAEGLLNANFRGGLSLELLTIYEVEQDPYSTGISQELDKFTAGLAQFLVNYRLSPKTRLRADVTWYSLDFDADRNAFREREDRAFSLSGFYRLLPKTSLLLQYEFIDIDYDQDVLSDSQEHRALTGLQWDVTVKTKGTIRVGYGWRDMDFGDDRDEFIGEVRLDHRFTPKTSAYMLFTRRIEETDVPGTQNLLSHRLQVGYRQLLTPRLTGNADLYYYRDSYRGDTTVGDTTDEREDDYYGARVTLGYKFRSWLTAGLGYHYLERDSNFAESDYTNNTVYLTLTAAI